MNRLIVFDCDGTLVDSQATIIAAMGEAFAAHGLPAVNPVAIRRVVGLSLVEAMQTLLPDQKAEAHGLLAESYKRAFHELRRRGMVEEPLYPGIAALLHALEARGFVLGVATGKSDRGLGLCLAGHGIAHHFVTLQTADRHPSKPHPAMLHAAIAEAGATPETTIMIGDTSYDMQMARAAGASAIGVDWGYHHPQELLDAGAHHVIDDTAALLRWIETSEERAA